MRVVPTSDGDIDGNDTETLCLRQGNSKPARSEPMNSATLDAHGPELILRCECGAIVIARGENQLVELARLHFGEFHPDLGAEMPADLILAMAEEKETQQR